MSSIRPEPRCNGGECIDRFTCKHATECVWDNHKIYSVGKDEYCGYYLYNGRTFETANLTSMMVYEIVREEGRVRAREGVLGKVSRDFRTTLVTKPDGSLLIDIDEQKQ